MNDGSGLANRDDDASQNVDVILAALPPDLLDGRAGDEVRRRACELARALQVAHRNFAAKCDLLESGSVRGNSGGPAC